ncbi:helix-turn-helix domain-containing protein [Futiania mangrovi]|uniref:DUF4115 domain-containing protein n=1 Tax=Futiania mangrovi TaxID=2959716 RepID=A0A9J6PE80_9PROT|nr:helix-turn-helix domain-containing protein [Futiania mangrovii]MCP1336136.1 DUF4115 domain-containing protein [Futiania mangrovii]
MDDETDRLAGAPMAALGETFRAARQSRGEELDAVAGNLRIRRSLLAALEDGNYAELPGPAYTVGFVKTYASYLGLDAAAAVERYKEETDGRTQSALVFKEPPEPARLPGLGTIAAALVVAALGAGAWALYAREGGDLPRIADIPPRLMAMLKGESAAPVPPAVMGDDGAAVPVSPPSADQASGERQAAAPAAGTLEGAPAPARTSSVAPGLRTAPAGDGGALTAVLPSYGVAEGRIGAGAPVPAEQAAPGEPPVQLAAPEQVPPQPSADRAAPDSAAAMSGEAASAPSQQAAATGPAQPAPAERPAQTPPAPVERSGEAVVPGAAPAPASPGQDGRPVPQPEVTVGIVRPQANPARLRGQAAAAPVEQTVRALAAGAPAAPPPVPVARALPTDTVVPATGAATVTAATGAGALSRAEDVGAPRASAPSRVTVRAVERAWVQIRDGDGDIVFSRILNAGETYRVPGDAGTATMITGNAGGVVLVLDGQQLPALGDVGEVRRNIPLSPAALAGWQP